MCRPLTYEEKAQVRKAKRTLEQRWFELLCLLTGHFPGDTPMAVRLIHQTLLAAKHAGDNPRLVPLLLDGEKE